MSSRALFHDEMSKTTGVGVSDWVEPPPSGDARSILPRHPNGHRNGKQSGYILHYHFVDCCLGGCRGNTEQVVTRWRRPVASGEALVMLHCVMHSISHRCTDIW